MKDYTTDVDKAAEDIPKDGERSKASTADILAYYFGDADKAKAVSQLAMLSTRIFVGNSFFFHLGAGQLNRTVTHKSTLAMLGSPSGDLTIDFKSTSVATVAYVGFGNQWSWDSGATIGVDWLGIYSPVKVSTTSSTTYQGQPPSELASEDVVRRVLNDAGQKAGDELGQMPGFAIFIAQIGWTF